MWPFKKKSADQALRKFVEDLSAALGPGLISVLVFGSKASGEYREGRSTINVFFVVDDITEDTLRQMAPGVQNWFKAGHPMPVFVEAQELPNYAKSFPIEFLDMQDHHQVVFGTDPLQGLTVDRVHLRAQCLLELTAKQLKLRQAVLLASGDPKRLRKVLLGSLPGVLTLCRAVLRLEVEVPKGDKILAARELSKRADFDVNVLERLWEIHMQRQDDNMEDLAWEYLECVERITDYVGRS